MQTALTRRLDLTCPVIQAPMAGTSTPELAAAVCEAGGLGSVAVGALTPEQARADIRSTRALTNRPFNVNLFCHETAAPDETRNAAWIEALRPLFTDFGVEPPTQVRNLYPSFNVDDAMLAVLLDERPQVVSFHFGLPDEARLKALKATGALLLATATSLAEAHQCQSAGIDVVVAQGFEAGGHRGVFDPARDTRMTTLPLARLLAGRLNIPVIAAGGIMDGAGIAAALALGAAAVQMGTAFIGCAESAASPAYRRALLGPTATSTRVTAAISGRPARGLENRFMQMVDETQAPPYPYAYDLGKALNAAALASDDEGFMPNWAGQGAPMARFMPAADLVADLVRELSDARKALARD